MRSFPLIFQNGPSIWIGLDEIPIFWSCCLRKHRSAIKELRHLINRLAWSCLFKSQMWIFSELNPQLYRTVYRWFEIHPIDGSSSPGENKARLLSGLHWGACDLNCQWILNLWLSELDSDWFWGSESLILTIASQKLFISPSILPPWWVQDDSNWRWNLNLLLIELDSDWCRGSESLILTNTSQNLINCTPNTSP